MQRRSVLILVVGLVFCAAVGLRVRSEMGRSQQRVTPPIPTATRSVSIPVPRDYVVEPMVVPEEADRGPGRIVSLAPSVTEIVCALGLRDRLVGRTPYCHHPPGIESVTAVGAIMDANYAAIKALEPDLILMTINSGSVSASLQKLNLRHEAVPHESLEEVYTAIERIGELCDRPRTAAALVSSIRADVEVLHRRAARSVAHPRRVLVVFGPLPVPPRAVFVAGPGIFFDRLVELAGHANAARRVLKSSQGEIPLEILRVIDPEVILEFREEPTRAVMADLYRSWSEVGDLQAIREQRVRSVGGPEWLSAGPRIAIELHRFITVLSEFE